MHSRRRQVGTRRRVPRPSPGATHARADHSARQVRIAPHVPQTDDLREDESHPSTGLLRTGLLAGLCCSAVSDKGKKFSKIRRGTWASNQGISCLLRCDVASKYPTDEPVTTADVNVDLQIRTHFRHEIPGQRDRGAPLGPALFVAGMRINAPLAAEDVLSGERILRDCAHKAAG